MRSVPALALALLCAGALALVPPHAAQAQSACGVMNLNVRGVPVRVLFAQNRAVQRYEIVKSMGTESDHDAILELTAKWGPEGVNAPPLRIIEYRQSEGGMRVPVKAIDSCGRVTTFR